MQPTTPPELARPAEAIRCRSPIRARAWWGDALVAASDAAVRVEEDGQSPALYFPRGDVRLDRFHDEGRTVTCPVKGTARLWSIEPADPAVPTDPGSPANPAEPHLEAEATADGPAARAAGGAVGGAAEVGAPGSTDLATAATAASDDWGGWDRLDDSGPDGHGGPDGRDVLWSFTEPAPAVAWLADHVAFDHDRVRVEVLDGDPDGDPRELIALRFPTWGDAADLVEVLDVQPGGDGTYRSVARGDWRRPVVEGSQMLAQALVAAARASGGRRAVSAHMVFPRAADADRPVVIRLDEVSSGRTFTTTSVQVCQDDRCCATGTVLLDETAPDLVRHEVAAPDGPGPDDCPPYDMSVTGRDLRIVDGAYTGDPDAPVGPPVLDAWVRFRDLPDDPILHAGLLAQFTGHLSIAAALRPHAGVGQHQAHRTLSTAVNAIAISFHADVHADRWMRYRHRSTFAGDGMTHAECRVHDDQGALLASFTVDAMVRRFTTGPGGRDDRRAM